MRKRKYFFLLPLLMLLLASASFQKVRVGIYDNPPLSFMDGDQPKGFFVDVLEQVAEEEGWQLEYHFCEWEACLQALERGEIDLLGPIAYSEERVKRFDFSAETLLTNWGQVYVQGGDTDTSILDLDGKSIALLKNDIHADFFLSIVEQFSIDVDAVYFDSYKEVLIAVENRYVDGGVVNHIFAMQHAREYDVEETGIIFNPIEVRFAATKGQHAGILQSLDRRIEAMENDPDSYYYAGLENWLSFGYQQENKIPDWVWWFLISVVLLSIVLLILNAWLRLEVKKRTYELSSSREELALILNNIPEMIAFVDKDERYLYVDDGYARWHGFSPDEVIGKRIDEVLPPKNYALIHSKLKGLFESGESFIFTHQAIGRDGRNAELVVSCIPKKDEDGRVEAFFVTARDTTQEKAAERALAESNEKYRQLVDNTFTGIFILQDEKIDFANQGFLKLFDYDIKEIAGLRLNDLVAPQDAERVLGEEDRKKSNEKRQSQYTFKALRRDGTSFDAEVFSQVIQYQGKRAVQGMLIDISGRTQAEARFQRLSEASYEAIFISERGICLEQNTAAERLFGYSNEEAIGRAATDWIAPEDRDLVMHHILSGYEEPYRTTALRKDGSTFPAEIIGRMMEYGSQKMRVTALRDISKQVEAEDVLRESEERYRKIVLDNRAIMFLIDPETGAIVEANQAASDFYGWSVAELLEKKISEINLWDESAVLEAIQQVLRKEKTHFFLQHQLANGDVRDVEVYGTPLNFFGRELLHSIVHDVSDRVAAEKALFESKERFERVVAEVPVALVITDEDGNVSFYNDRFVEVFGYTLHDITFAEDWWKYAYPDEAYRVWVKDTWDAAIKEAHLSGERIATQTWDMVRKDGQVRTVEFDMMPLGDISVIAMNDITERVAIEQALRESKERFEKIIAKAPIPMGILTPERDIYNERFTEIFGYTNEDVKNWWDLLYPDEAYRIKAKKSWDETIVRAKETGTQPETQVWQVAHKNGELRTVEFDMVPLDEISVIAMNDITDIVRATEALKSSEQNLKEAQKIGKIGHWELDLKTDELVLSEQVVDMLNIDTEKINISTEGILALVHPDEREKLQEELEEAIDQKKSLDVTHRIVLRDGDVIFVHARSRTVYAEDGEALRVIGTMQDVTKETVAEKVLSLRAELTEFSLDHSLDDILRKTLDEIEALTGSRIGFCYFIDQKQDNISLQEWSTHTLEGVCRTDNLDGHYPIEQAGVWAECIKTKTPIIHNDYVALSNKKGLPVGHADIVRELVVPVVRQNKVVAVLGMGNKLTEYTQQDVGIVAQIADFGWDIVEYKLSEQALEESRSLLLETQQVARLGSYRLYLDTEKWTSNLILDEIFGIDEQYARTVSGWEALVHPDDREMMRLYLTEHVLEKRLPFDKEYRILRQNDQETRWVHGLGQLAYDNAGKPVSMVGTIQDITESAIAKENLRTSEQRLRTLINASPDIICFKDGEGRWLTANDAALTWFDLIDVDYIGKTDQELFEHSELYADGYQKFEKADELAWQRASLTRQNEIAVTRNGERILDVIKVPLFRVDGTREALVVIGRDITEEIEAREELQRHARQLEIVNSISAALSTSLELEDLLKTILHQVVQVVPCESASIFLVEDNGLRIVNAVGEAEPLIGRSFQLENTLMSKIKPEDNVVVIEDVLEDPAFTIWEAAPVIRAWMGLPLYAHDNLVGYLTFDSVRPAVFGLADQSLAVAFATQIAQALHNAQMHERVIVGANELEKRVQKRTAELQEFVDLTAGREVRMIELKEIIRALRKQLVRAGHVPVAGDSLEID